MNVAAKIAQATGRSITVRSEDMRVIGTDTGGDEALKLLCAPIAARSVRAPEAA